jgi:hypothetical protein
LVFLFVRSTYGWLAVRPRDEYSLISHVPGADKTIGTIDKNVGTQVAAALADRPA